VPLLSQACDLGSVGYIASDGVLKLSVFKMRRAIPERVQTTLATRSGSETKGQVRGPDEFSAQQRLDGNPVGSAQRTMVNLFLNERRRRRPMPIDRIPETLRERRAILLIGRSQ
jgi:hypothetical protein